MIHRIEGDALLVRSEARASEMQIYTSRRLKILREQEREKKNSGKSNEDKDSRTKRREREREKLR